MKTLDNYIVEKLNLSKVSVYNHAPKTEEELQEILKDRLKEDKNADLNDIDVSNITDMKELFFGLDPHNIDISEWDVSNVTNMSYMFAGCTNFNSDLSKWDVSNVENIEYMFFECNNFNSDISNWDVSKVTNMDEMFCYCDKINADLSKWNVSNVKSWIGFAVDTPYNIEANYKLLPHWPKKKRK